LYCQFGHSFVRHAVEHGSADQALHSTIEALLEAADQVAVERSLTAEALAAFDDDLLEPIIRRGQTQGIWSRAAPSARLALALRSLIAGLHTIGIQSHQDRPALIRQIEILFSEAAENAPANTRSAGPARYHQTACTPSTMVTSPNST
jgi:hypothetical protein